MPVTPTDGSPCVRKYQEVARSHPGTVFEIIRSHFKPRFALAVLATFGDRAKGVWDALIKKGYIDTKGNVQPAFSAMTREGFDLDRTLEQDEVLDAFEDMGPTIWREMGKCGYVNARGVIQKGRVSLTTPETTLLFNQLKMHDRERPVALRVVGSRVELTVEGRDYVGQDAYLRFEDEELLVPQFVSGEEAMGSAIIAATHYGEACSVMRALSALDDGSQEYTITITIKGKLAGEVGGKLVIGETLGTGSGAPIVQPPSLLDLDPANFDSLPDEVRAVAASPEELAQVPVYVPGGEILHAIPCIVPDQKYPKEKAAHPDAVFEIIGKSRGFVTMADLSAFHEKASVIWGALLRRRYIDKSGRINRTVQEGRGSFQLDTALLPGHFSRLEGRGKEIRQALVDGGFMDRDYNVQRPEYKLSAAEQGRIFDILTDKKGKSRMALRVLGPRFELTVLGREYISDAGRLAQDETVYLVPKEALFFNGARVAQSAIEVVGYRGDTQCDVVKAFKEVEAGNSDYGLEVRVKGLLADEIGAKLHFG
ncbi:MAG: hypothetical protein NT099_02520 [Candidatus Saganbacteria bacterium]|nr:hypothetical protein [Candidatus Saganbacteria bacterium]